MAIMTIGIDLAKNVFAFTASMKTARPHWGQTRVTREQLPA